MFPELRLIGWPFTAVVQRDTPSPLRGIHFQLRASLPKLRVPGHDEERNLSIQTPKKKKKRKKEKKNDNGALSLVSGKVESLSFDAVKIIFD